MIGFGGRVLDRGEPKYLNSPETPVFSKGRELYGLFEARAALRQRGYALVVEGYMDVVALAQLGFANAVATLGTACTADHVQKLFRFTDSVVFSFDGDAAGRRAARRALEASLPHASDTRTLTFLFLPPEHDPDSYVREHGARLSRPASRRRCRCRASSSRAPRDGCDLATAEGRAHMLANAQAVVVGAARRRAQAPVARRPGGRRPRRRRTGLAPMGPRQCAARACAGRPASPARARPLSKGTANLLDRAVWLLLHRSEIWAELDGEAHDILRGQAAPYDPLRSRASSVACTSTARSRRARCSPSCAKARAGQRRRGCRALPGSHDLGTRRA